MTGPSIQGGVQEADIEELGEGRRVVQCQVRGDGAGDQVLEGVPGRAADQLDRGILVAFQTAQRAIEMGAGCMEEFQGHWVRARMRR